MCASHADHRLEWPRWACTARTWLMARLFTWWSSSCSLIVVVLAACSADAPSAGPAAGGVAGTDVQGLGGVPSSVGGSAQGAGGAAASGGSLMGGDTGVGGAMALGGANSGGVTTFAGGAHSGGAFDTAGGGTGGTATSVGGSEGGGAPSELGGATNGGVGGSLGMAGAGPAGGGTTSGGAGSPTSGGASSTGGTSAGETVCGIASEGERVTLRCPEGQVIDAVLFASYGEPAGECGGAFTVSQCHAASSETAVGSLCVGRGACTVAAANGTFGDPCSGVVKSLAVEVSCVVGEPTVVPSGPYKGIANSPASEIAALGATWCYNWTTSPEASDCDDPLFVPMI